MKPELIRRVRPRYSDRYLGNPHKGCCTFQRFNGDPLYPGTWWSEEGPTEFPEHADPVLHRRITDWSRWEGTVRGYLPCTVAYCRWFWRLLEPREGEYDFSVVEKAVEAARRQGQTLAVRLMAYGSSSQPQLPDWYVGKYPVEVRRPKSAEQKVPIHDAPEYLAKWGGLIREFGRRFDGRIESIDMAYIGPWGEGAGECSAAQCDRFAALWRDSFPNTPRMALIDGRQMRAGLATGSGWRCDCFGDTGIRHSEGALTVPRPICHNHHFDSYPKAIVTSGAQDAWKTGPVHLETCGVPMDWYRRGLDLDFILQQGLKFHATYFMPKSAALPEPWVDRLAAFCRQLGYRFAFRQAILPRTVKPGAPMPVEIWIENVGVAPIYHRYALAFRFRQDGKELFTTLPDIDIRTWLPGDAWLTRDVPVPAGLRPGWVDLSVGLVDEHNQARIRFAAEETYLDRWLDLAGFEILP